MVSHSRLRQVLGLIVTTGLMLGGLIVFSTVAAQAHQGSISVQKTECVDGDTMKATYRWSWSSVPREAFGTEVVRKTGTTSFEGSWRGSGGSKLVTVNQTAGAVEWTVTIKKSQFSGSSGPWEYVYSPWRNGHNGARYHDTRVENFDWSKCQPTIVRDASASLSKTPATCSSGEKLTLGRVTNATWGTPSRTEGPGDYSVTATANSGHAFDDGSSTRTFTGTLGGKLDPNTNEGCRPPAPEPKVDHAAATRTTCAGVEYREWNSESHPVWNSDTRSWGWSEPVKTNDTGWRKDRDLTPAEQQQLGCVAPPAPQPITVKGKVKKLDKCGSNNFFFAKEVAGLHYVLKGKVVREGVWIKAKAKKVRIKLVADSSRYVVTGKKAFVLKFPNQRPCSSAPHKSPPTGK